MIAHSIKGSGQKRAIMFAPFFSAESLADRASMVARALIRCMPVDLVTSDFNHSLKLRQDIVSCAPFEHLTCLPTASYRSNISAKRLLSHILLALRAAAHFWRVRDAYDVVYVTLPTNTLAWLILILSGTRRKIVDIVDVWPDVLPFSKMIRRFFWPVLSVWKWFFTASIGRADLVLGVSDSFLSQARPFAKQDAQLRRFCIGQDLLASATPKQALFTLAYVGNIGHLYDFETLIDALSGDELRGRVQLFVVGNGDRRDWLLAELESRNIPHRYWGVVYDPAQLAAILRSCHVGFNGYRRTSASFSYKASTYLAAGLPIVNSMTGDLEQIVRERSLGENYKSEDCGELRESLLRMYNDETGRSAKNCEEFFAECLEKEHLLDTMETLFKEFLSGASPRTGNSPKDGESNLIETARRQICDVPRGTD